MKGNIYRNSSLGDNKSSSDFFKFFFINTYGTRITTHYTLIPYIRNTPRQAQIAHIAKLTVAIGNTILAIVMCLNVYCNRVNTYCKPECFAVYLKNWYPVIRFQTN